MTTGPATPGSARPDPAASGAAIPGAGSSGAATPGAVTTGPASHGLGDDVLRRCDAYLDAAPREYAEVVDVGPLRAFVSRAPWPYYLRPRSELDLGGPDAVTPDDVVRAAGVLLEHGQAVSVEWVAELVPSLAPALEAAGYAVTLHPLLALDLSTRTPHAGPTSRDHGAVPVTGPGKPAQHHDHADEVRAVPGAELAHIVLDADSPEVAAALVVSDLGFGEPGTAVAVTGVPERDLAVADEDRLAFVRGRVRDGRSVLAVLDAGPAGVVCSGWHQPVDGVTEVVGVATLPAFRRRGFAAHVVSTLLDDAAARGCTLALLSASDDDVARVYERVGFTRIGHAGAAEPTPLP